MNPAEIRLKVLEMTIPTASRYGIDHPELIVDKCRIFENYVLESQTDEVSDSSSKRKPGRPRKEKTENDVPDFLDPTRGGQVELDR